MAAHDKWMRTICVAKWLHSWFRGGPRGSLASWSLIYSLYIVAWRFQDVRAHVGRVQGVLGQTGPLPPGADEEDERPHPGNQQVRRRAGQDSPQGKCTRTRVLRPTYTSRSVFDTLWIECFFSYFQHYCYCSFSMKALKAWTYIVLWRKR